MNDTLAFSSIMIFGVFVASCSQIMLKSSANRVYERKLFEYLNSKVIIAYVLLLISSVIGMYVLRHINLSSVAALTAFGYLFVPILSRLFFKEKINVKQVVGVFLIVVGVVVFSF